MSDRSAHWPDPDGDVTISRAIEDDDVRYLAIMLHTDPRVTYVIDSRGRTWKLVEHGGHVSQFVWHVPDGGRPGWTLTDELPPFDPESH